MPIINVKIVKGRSIEAKQQFAAAITQEAVKIFNVKEDWVTVIYDEYDRENWASSGQLHSIKFGEGFGKQGVE